MGNVKILLKKLIKFLFFLVGFPFTVILHFFSSKLFNRSSVTVLLLHDMTEAQAQKMSVLIKLLSYFGRFISPEEFEAAVDGQITLSGANFFITFDDGFTSSGQFAKKYLQPLDIRAAFFVCPNFIGSQNHDAHNFIIRNLYLNQYSPGQITEYQGAMNIEQILDLRRAGHKIGSHTMSHLKLSSTNHIETLENEIVGSKIILEKMLSEPITWFAYPFGDLASISPSALQVIAKNFKFNFTGIRGSYSCKDSRMAIWRECITPAESLFYCFFIALGGLRFSYFKRRKIFNSYLAGA